MSNNMEWKEVARFSVTGDHIVAKDAMIMLDEEEFPTSWPSVASGPGDYVLEIIESSPSYVERARVRKLDSLPAQGKQLASLDIDHAYAAFIDHQAFVEAITEDYDEYEDWTAMELDDELANKQSGEIEFNGAQLFYVQSGVGDGSYDCYELTEGDVLVGLECNFGKESVHTDSQSSETSFGIEMSLDFGSLEFKLYLWPHADLEDVQSALNEELREIADPDELRTAEQFLAELDCMIGDDEKITDYSDQLNSLKAASYRLYNKDEETVSSGEIDVQTSGMQTDNLNFKQLCEWVSKLHAQGYQKEV